MRAKLKPHPVTPADAVDAIDVEAVREGPRLRLHYLLTGRMKGIALPEPAGLVRMDGLWRTTCFEAFVKGEGTDGYVEFNLSPSGEWQAYRFDGYRSGGEPAEVAAPQMEVSGGPDRLEVEAVLEVPLEGDWRLGLTAVVEGEDGSVSYWALEHAPGRPDFHHADCFAAHLKADERS